MKHLRNELKSLVACISARIKSREHFYSDMDDDRKESIEGIAYNNKTNQLLQSLEHVRSALSSINEYMEKS